MNYRSSLDFEKELVDFWQYACPTEDTTASQKANRKQNPEEQIWRYPVKKKTGDRKERVLVIQGYADEIKKVADEMEADDKDLKDEVDYVKWAADQIDKMAKRIVQIRWENKQKAKLLKMEAELNGLMVFGFNGLLRS